LLRAPLPKAPIIDRSTSQPPAVARPEQAVSRNSNADDAPSGAARASSNASLEFRSEFAALLAFYVARIAAARRSLAPSIAAAIVQAIMNEQTVALRGLMEREHAATQKQRDERPQRPDGNVQRKDEGPSRS
jgi:hypothetical protein